MNPFTKNAVIAGLVALVVALGVVFGARAISPDDMNSGVAVKVMAPDGSVVGTTEPIKMASSGPPVPACSTVGTKLNCQGPGLPFDWVSVNFGDSGSNEAFGTLNPGTYTTDAGLPTVALATITPSQTGDLSLIGGFNVVCVTDGGLPKCPDGGGIEPGGMAIVCSIHGDASQGLVVAAAQPIYVPNTNTFGISTAGTIANLNTGSAYDCYLLLDAVGGGGSYSFTDAAVGGIWVHEFP